MCLVLIPVENNYMWKLGLFGIVFFIVVDGAIVRQQN